MQSWNEGLWKQPLPDVRKFLTSGHACPEVTNITAHDQNGFLSLTAPLGKKNYFPSSLQRVAFLGSFENTDFTQLGFADNLELQGEDIDRNQLNTLLVCRTETINRYPGPRGFSWFFFAKERASREAATTSRESDEERERKTSGYLGLESHFHADDRVRIWPSGVDWLIFFQTRKPIWLARLIVTTEGTLKIFTPHFWR